jgi:hypothetical protein
MIDWVSLGFGALWIFGLALVTAALSSANYLASRQKRHFKQMFEMSFYHQIIDLGFIFFCLGWAGGASTLLERVLWVVLALLFVLQMWQTRKVSSV